MAGFFGFFDYTKPGPGIPKDAPPKARIVVFFEVFFRKFWNLVKINFMFLLFNLPAVIVAWLATWFFIRNNMMDGIKMEFSQNIAVDKITMDALLRFIIAAFFMCIPIITVGPAQAGFTYLLRNYAREEHAFIWSDFKEHALKNIKESTAICLIDIVITYLLGIALNFYVSYNSSNILATVATVFIIMSFIIFLMMHMYIYPILVTFKLNVKQVYRNAFIFAIAKFFPNLGIMIICAAIILVTFYITPIGFILYIFLTISFIGLITNFYVYPKMKKYMMAEEDSEEDSGDYPDQEFEEDDEESKSGYLEARETQELKKIE